MRLATILFAITGLVGIGPLQQSRATQTRAAQQAAVADVTRMVRAYYETFNSGGPGAVAALYAKDAQTPFFSLTTARGADGAPEPTGTAGTVGENTPPPAEKGSAGAEMAGAVKRMTVTANPDLSVTVRGTVAWSTSTFRAWLTPVEGPALQVDGRHTIVWERRGKDWVIAHEHVSAPFTVPAPKPARPDTSRADEESIRRLIQSYGDAWTRGDAAASAAMWEQDGDVGSLSTGDVTRGRDQIAQLFSGSMARRSAPVTLTSTVSSVHFVDPDVAVADGTFEYVTEVKKKPTSVLERYSMTLHKTDDRWLIKTARLTPAAPAPHK